MLTSDLIEIISAHEVNITDDIDNTDQVSQVIQEKFEIAWEVRKVYKPPVIIDDETCKNTEDDVLLFTNSYSIILGSMFYLVYW